MKVYKVVELFDNGLEFDDSIIEEECKAICISYEVALNYIKNLIPPKYDDINSWREKEVKEGETNLFDDTNKLVIRKFVGIREYVYEFGDEKDIYETDEVLEYWIEETEVIE